MLRSILETQKLFRIEGVEAGRVNIEISQYLLALSENKQKNVLSSNLKNLKKDLERYERAVQDLRDKNNDLNTVQLKVLMHIIEGLLCQT